MQNNVLPHEAADTWLKSKFLKFAAKKPKFFYLHQSDYVKSRTTSQRLYYRKVLHKRQRKYDKMAEHAGFVNMPPLLVEEQVATPLESNLANEGKNVHQIISPFTGNVTQVARRRQMEPIMPYHYRIALGCFLYFQEFNTVYNKGNQHIGMAPLHDIVKWIKKNVAHMRKDLTQTFVCYLTSKPEFAHVFKMEATETRDVIAMTYTGLPVDDTTMHDYKLVHRDERSMFKFGKKLFDSLGEQRLLLHQIQEKLFKKNRYLVEKMCLFCMRLFPNVFGLGCDPTNEAQGSVILFNRELQASDIPDFERGYDHDFVPSEHAQNELKRKLQDEPAEELIYESPLNEEEKKYMTDCIEYLKIVSHHSDYVTTMARHFMLATPSEMKKKEESLRYLATKYPTLFTIEEDEEDGESFFLIWNKNGVCNQELSSVAEHAVRHLKLQNKQDVEHLASKMLQERLQKKIIKVTNTFPKLFAVTTEKDKTSITLKNPSIETSTLTLKKRKISKEA